MAILGYVLVVYCRLLLFVIPDKDRESTVLKIIVDPRCGEDDR